MGHVLYNAAHILYAKFGWKYQVNTPPLPRGMQDGAECFFSHTSTSVTVVQWPYFGHSTTLNNKGYKAHKEIGCVS